MKLIIMCICLTSSIAAVPLPSFFHFLPHFGPRQAGPPTQGNNVYPAGQPLQPNMNGAVSMEIVFPPRFPGQATGGQMNGQAFLKYSVPKAPGRKSVEIYYPFDFTQVSNIPQLFPYDNSPQTLPQQDPIMPPFEARRPLALDPLQPAKQDQPGPLERRGQVPVHP